jgi:hypothetical protein
VRIAVAILACLAVTAAAVAARSPRDPRQAFIRADRAAAARIVLNQDDLPSYKQVRVKTGTGELRCPKLDYDPNYSRLVQTGQAFSPTYLTTGGTSVASSAELYASPAQARTAFVRSLGHGFTRCLAEQLNARHKAGISIRVTSVVNARFGKLGARTVSLFVNASIVTKKPFPVVITFVGFQKGRAVVHMTALAAQNPFPNALARKLARRLSRRTPG